MKKILIFFIFSFQLLTSVTFAIDESCFQFVGKIEKPEAKTIKIITDEVNNYYFQDGNLLNTKIFKSNYNYIRKKIDFYVGTQLWDEYSTQFNQYDENKEVVINFPTTLPKNTFKVYFDTNNYNYHFEISRDGQNWLAIEDYIINYDLDFVKIIFDNKDLKNTEIYSLYFYKLDLENNNEILVNSISNNDIKVFSNYVCDDNELGELIRKTRKTKYFPIDLNTKSYNLTMEYNPVFDANHTIEYKFRDTDNDGVFDIDDNCKYDYNPDQLDSDVSGIGDVCSDKDRDSKYGNEDNCPIIYNPNQEDENKNGIGDACEIDTDGDKIFDIEDNCQLIANFNQFDTDNDGVGDECDNCKEKYNVNQKDIDKDEIGDVCDDKDDRYIESNKGFFTVLVIVISLVFLSLIFVMINNIKETK